MNSASALRNSILTPGYRFMNRILIIAVTALALTACGGKDEAAATAAPEAKAETGHAEDKDEHGHGEDAAKEVKKGPHGGRLLEDGAFAVELAIFEQGVPPEYRAWVTQAGKPVAPGTVRLGVTLERLGGVTDQIAFTPKGDFLRGDSEVYEPHSFTVRIEAAHDGESRQWSYDSFEGRTTIAADIAKQAGIQTAVAGSGVITESLTVYGAIVADATRVREVKARFPGLIRGVSKQVGDTVRAGEVLATVESNDSLQRYPITAPITGIVTQRHAEPGEQTGDAALFEVADFSSVWGEFKVFPRDRARLKTGQRVRVGAEGGISAESVLDYIAPLGSRESQALLVRATLDNSDGRWTPGQFVSGTVTVGETPVELAVPLSALQGFRDFTVVFAQVDETYEVRMLELGRRDTRNVEVLGGLKPGTVYVTENSYLIKADIEKSGASHDH